MIKGKKGAGAMEGDEDDHLKHSLLIRPGHGAIDPIAAMHLEKPLHEYEQQLMRLADRLVYTLHEVSSGRSIKSANTISRGYSLIVEKDHDGDGLRGGAGQTRVEKEDGLEGGGSGGGGGGEEGEGRGERVMERILNPSMKNLIPICDKVIQACMDKESREFLEARWNRVKNQESSPPKFKFNDYSKQVLLIRKNIEQTRTDAEGESATQSSGSILNLYAHAAARAAHFDELNGSIHQEMLSGGLDRQFELTPAVLASGSELVHQVVMSRNASTSEDAEVEIVKLKSVLSATVTCTSMNDIAETASRYLSLAYKSTNKRKQGFRGDDHGAVAMKLTDNGVVGLTKRRITITDVVDTFIGKAKRDGSRDLQIFFYFTADPHRHIMRMTIMHSSMCHSADPNGVLHRLSSRATGVLTRLGFEDLRRRGELIRKCRATGEWSIRELVHLGIPADELVEQGYDEQELRMEGGFTKDELEAARVKSMRRINKQASTKKMLFKSWSGLKGGDAKVAPSGSGESGVLGFGLKDRTKLFGIPLAISGQDGTDIKKGVIRLLPHNVDIYDYYPPVVVSYATGTRNMDTKGNGPGMYYASRLIHSLKAKGIDSFSGLHVPPGVNWRIFFDKLDGADSKAKVLIVVVTPALYNSPVCLEEIHAGLSNSKITLKIPVLFEEPIPRKDFMWGPKLGLKGEKKLYRRDVLNRFTNLNTTPAPGQEINDFDSILTEVAETVKEHLGETELTAVSPAKAGETAEADHVAAAETVASHGDESAPPKVASADLESPQKAAEEVPVDAPSPAAADAVSVHQSAPVQTPVSAGVSMDFGLSPSPAQAQGTGLSA